MRSFVPMLTATVLIGATSIGWGAPAGTTASDPPANPKQLLQRAFGALDADGNGVIEKDEFAREAGKVGRGFLEGAGKHWRGGERARTAERPGRRAEAPRRGWIPRWCPRGWSCWGPCAQREWSGPPGKMRGFRGPAPGAPGLGGRGGAFARPLPPHIRELIEHRVREIVRDELRRLKEHFAARGKHPPAPAFRPPGKGLGPGPHAGKLAPKRQPERAAEPRKTRPGKPQPGKPAKPRPAKPPAPPAGLNALDLNRDGVIDAREMRLASETLKRLDKNADGKVTRDELRGSRRPAKPGSKPPARAPGQGPKKPCGPQPKKKGPA